MKRWIPMLLALVMCVLFSAGMAEDAEKPVLIDRINSPDEHADFAFAEDAELFEVIFPQILNCDAALLRCGDETMLVDCATQGQSKRILDMFGQLGIAHVDRVINTHPHEDHIGGFRDLIKAITVDELLICFAEDANDHMRKAVGYAQNAGIPVVQYADGDVLTLGGATIQVMKMDGKISELNDCSAQYLITFGNRTLMMAADLEKTGQKKLVDLVGAEVLKADILKYPHHGLEKLTDEYAQAVSARYYIITNNQRSTEGKKYIQRSGVSAAWTVPGFIYLATDGETWLVDRIVSEIKY